MRKGNWEEVLEKWIFLWPRQLEIIYLLLFLFSSITIGRFSHTWLFTKVRRGCSVVVPSLAMNRILPPFTLWHSLTHHRFYVHNFSLKNRMVWDVRMFQEIMCVICKKKIKAPRRDELHLQVIKDFGVKHLQKAWVSWRDSSRNYWKFHLSYCVVWWKWH